MLEGINLFRLAGGRMQYLAERQSIIARNVANADTPGYVSRDLTPFDPASILTHVSRDGGGSALSLARTCTDHLGGATSVAATGVAITGGYGEKPDGNAVSIEEQMVKSADNANAFALVSAAYAKSIAIMKMSIDK
jgi:flagellar basal-body rod protein FlgB